MVLNVRSISGLGLGSIQGNLKFSDFGMLSVIQVYNSCSSEVASSSGLVRHHVPMDEECLCLYLDETLDIQCENWIQNQTK